MGTTLGFKEKKKIIQELSNKDHAEADLELLKSTYPEFSILNRVSRNPVRYYEEIISELVDRVGRDQIRLYRREYEQKKIEKDAQEEETDPVTGGYRVPGIAEGDGLTGSNVATGISAGILLLPGTDQDGNGNLKTVNEPTKEDQERELAEIRARAEKAEAELQRLKASVQADNHETPAATAPASSEKKLRLAKQAPERRRVPQHPMGKTPGPRHPNRNPDLQRSDLLLP